MSLVDIKNKSQGFTIVELLIVVVVIAILAAITIVSYNGITNRADQSAAKAAASTAQKKIELFQAENGRYPISKAELAGDSTKSWYLPATSFGGEAPVSDAGSAQQGIKWAQVRVCASAAAPVTPSTVTGARITYWNYDPNLGDTTDITLGTCSATAPAIIVAIPAS